VTGYDLFIALHQGLISAQHTAPCLSGIDYAASQQTASNTYIIGLDFIGFGTPGLDLTASPVTLDASHEHTLENDNKLTVTFKQIDLDGVPEFRTISNKPFDPKLFSARITTSFLDDPFAKG
jgi:hypothetical protein